jgi:PAS domain S-box-containing protein
MNEKVLLVDDDEAIREVLSLSIADLGYEVAAAADGREALEQCKTFGPSIVLTDIKMPGMDGIELLSRIKAMNPDIEVIMISGHGDMELAIASLKLDALDFITKPIRDELLVAALSRAAERITMRRQIREHTQNLEQIVREKSARLVELERRLAVGQTVEGLSDAMQGLITSLAEGPSYFNQMPCFIAIHSRFLEIVAANALARERLGEVVGKMSWDLYADRQGSGNACPVWMTVEQGKGQRGRETFIDRDGREIPVIVHTAPVFGAEGKVELVIEIAVDVTEVGRLQEELRAAREKYQRLFDAVPCAIAVMTSENGVAEANRLWRADFGEAGGVSCHRLFAHRDEPCEPCPVFDTFLDGEPHETETVITTRCGVQKNVLLRTAPIRDASGQIEQVIEIAADITQVRALQDHLSSLGLMLGSMSHGVKGLLTSLDGGMYKVDKGLDKEELGRVREGWDVVSDKIGRIRKMVLDILYYAKSREPQLLPVDVALFASDLAGIVEPKATARGVGFRLQLGEELGKLPMDETALTSALVNLLENAVDACADDHSKDGHEVTFSVSLDRREVVLAVADNGMGMDQSTRERMFTLFFSSKGSRGTGLGLFIANQIVTEHGGRIAVDSTPGQGTTIAVRLPLEGPPRKRDLENPCGNA